MAERTLTVKILGDATSAQRALGKLDDSTGKSEGRFAKFGAVAKVAMVGAGLAAIKFGKDSADAFNDSQKVAAQTEAVIKSTGGAAGVTGEHIAKMSEKLQALSGVEDEAIQSGQNMLLTFTNLKNEAGAGNDVFDQATKTLLDMSVALGTDAKTSAVQLGKALNDPIAGISALSRVGVTFTAEQKATIKTMVEMGDTAGAQKVILAELNKEFGGSAKAAGDAQSPMEKLSLRFGDLQEKVGAHLIPALEKLTVVGLAVINFVSNLHPGVVAAIGVVAGLAVAVLAISKAIQAWTAVQAALNVVLTLNPIGLVIAAVAAFAAGIVIAYKNSETFRSVVQTAFGAVKTYVELATLPIRTIIKLIGEAIGLVQKLARAIPNLPGLPKGLDKVPGIPFLAHGGIARAGKPHIVGEEGPELFIPGTTGTVIPNNRLSTGGSGGAAATVVNNYSYTVHVAGNVVSERDLIDAVASGLEAKRRRNGPGDY